jgi:hypothetical protein
MKQLELFETDKRPEIEIIREEWERTRKALFMQISECKKQYNELAHEHMLLKLNICRGRLPI